MNALVALVPAAVAIGAIALLRASRVAERFVDRPGERSLHAVPTPRIGGIGLMLGALPVVYLNGTEQIRWIAAAAAVLAVVSAIDDAKSLPVSVRLACHLAAAAVAVGVAWPGAQGAVAAVIVAAAAIASIAWMTNLFNFMDGADGLAGGMALVGFAALAWGAVAGGDTSLAFASIAVSAGAGGFLVFNVPPARVFMGDAGSVPLGFLAGALGWLGAEGGAWPAWFPVLVFSPFIVDATVTLAKRAARGEALARAHRGHHYQRLVLAGWSHRRLALAGWALMVASAASAVAALGRHAAVQGAIISLWVIAYGALLWWIDRRSSRGRS